MNIQKTIEEKSGVQLNGFPQSDFNDIEELLGKDKKIEVWLLKGMGRYYLKGFPSNKNDTAFPIQKKLCNLT